MAILATVATLATTTGHSNAFAFGILTLLEERAIARDAAVPLADMMVGQVAIVRASLVPIAMPLNDRDYTLTVRDAAGLVDLNTAAPQMLTAPVRGCRLRQAVRPRRFIRLDRPRPPWR